MPDVDMQTTQERELSFGEKAVGLSFNPGGNEEVQRVKSAMASLIDLLDVMRKSTDEGEKKRLYSIAITEAQSAQMWAVKAITY